MTELAELLASLDLEPPALPDGAVITDAIVIFRYANPAEGPGMGTSFVASRGMDAALRLGSVELVHSRISSLVAQGWNTPEDD